MGTNFDNLWMFSYEKRLQALETTFVQGVKDGSLDPVVSGGFVIQDCVFLYEEYRCIKSAMDKATDGQMKACLKKLTQRYEGYYVDAFEKWHINPNNTSSVQLDEACQEYISYIQNAADNMATIDFLLSIAPCLSLWSWLGDEIKGKNHGVYDNWIRNNFVGGVDLQGVEDLINGDKDLHIARAIAIFNQGMGHEVEFFKSAGN